MKEATLKTISFSFFQIYDMSGEKIGQALIINNQYFGNKQLVIGFKILNKLSPSLNYVRGHSLIT